MSDTKRYGVGLLLVIAAIALLAIQQGLWALLPAAAAVYVLGSLLYEKIFG